MLLRTSLQKAGLSSIEAELLLWIRDNPGKTISESERTLSFSKSALYRAQKELLEDGLLRAEGENWEQPLFFAGFEALLQKMNSEQQKNKRLISQFQAFSLGISTPLGKEDFLETLSEEETFDRYLGLAEGSYDAVIAFGNWEDLNEKRNLVALEKSFVSKRLKKGARAFVAAFKAGPNTKEIIDGSIRDKNENRLSKLVQSPIVRPFWVTAFEGNDFVQLFRRNKKSGIESTFLKSPAIAEMYRDMAYSHMV